MSKKGKIFKELLKKDGLIVAPGATTALFAKVIETAGYELVFVTGAGVANMNFCLPDYGLINMVENLEIVKRINDAVEVPLLVDIDDGYGNPMSVYRTGKEFSRLGVGGVILEDQKAPKRCGHFEDHQVIETHEMCSKLRALRDGSVDDDMIVVARSDAISVNGIDDAIERGNAYVEAGADVVFIEAPRTVEMMTRIPNEINAPTLINLVEKGKTPLLNNRELEKLGFKIAIYANAPMKAAIKGTQLLLEYLKREGTTDGCDDELMIPSAERHVLTNKQFYYDLQKKYK